MKPSTFFARKKTRQLLERRIDDLVFVFAILGFIAVFIDVGAIQTPWESSFETFYHFNLVLFLALFSFRAYLERFVFERKRKWWLVLMETVFLAFLLLVQTKIGFLEGLASRGLLQFGISLIFLVEISKRSLGLERLKVNPPLLFIFSFVLIIVVGAMGLMLPISTHEGISAIDAFFTSTSAVCVTGLTVVDTGAHFTRFGQNVILVLISLGGLGVMTFTSFFGFFFKGGASFRNQLIYKDFTGADTLTEVFSFIKKVVTFTLGVEAVGFLLIYFNLDSSDFPSLGEKIYFALFHAISAFNNAGFQLKSAGIYDELTRWNYPFQLTICALIIFGGLGFPISFNIVKYLRSRLKVRLRQVVFGEAYRNTPWILNINSRIVLLTSFILLAVGTLALFATEYHASLKEHDSFFGKLISAFFLSVTPRTAGFNNIDMANLSREGILLTMLLMWIGASPSSTGGGIKTTTYAIATLGIFNIARGRMHVEIGKREIAQESLMRAFIIICMSLVALGISTLAVGYFDPQLDLIALTFECFSAFGTVGLSLGITANLSSSSKVVIILTMFIGRVGTYTLLLAILKKALDTKLYKYPVEHVIIT